MSNSSTVLVPSSPIADASAAPHAPEWNVRNYLGRNLVPAVLATIVSYYGAMALGGQELFNMWVMVTSHVHFGMSYLFHYASLKRSLDSPGRRAAFWGIEVFGSLLFPVLYLKVVPYPINSFLFMSYFMVHMMRDEQLMLFQRSSGYQQRPKSRFAFVWLVLITLLTIVAVYAPFRGSKVPAQELLPAALRSDALLLGALGVIAIGGIVAIWRCASVRIETRIAACGALFISTAATGYFSFDVAQDMMSWDLNGPLILLHYMSWYLFGGSRIADFERRIQTGQVPATPSHDPWFKYKSSTKNFLKLVAVLHIVLVPLGLVWYFSHTHETWLNYLFDKRYLPILSFPHITLHFLPTGRFQAPRPVSAVPAQA